jgi:hypothetical protein
MPAGLLGDFPVGKVALFGGGGIRTENRKVLLSRIPPRRSVRSSKKEVPESRLLAPGREQIKGAVCKTYYVNEPRNVAIYLILRLRGEGVGEICREFHLNRYSSASSATERVKVKMSRDRQLKVLQFSH